MLLVIVIIGNVQSPPLRTPPKAESGPDRFPWSVRYRLGGEESRFEVDEAVEGNGAAMDSRDGGTVLDGDGNEDAVDRPCIS